MTEKPNYRVLDNIQADLPDGTLVFLLETLTPPETHTTDGGHRLYVSVKMHNESTWIKDQTLAEFVATFPHMEEYAEPGKKPDWFMDDEQGREFRRASNKIAMASRRGCGQSIYYNGDLTEQHHLRNGQPFFQTKVDWVPEGYGLVLYEANPMDVAFVYRDGYGILPNRNYQNYGRLVRLV